MADHLCNHEATIKDMHQRMIAIDERLRGNGKPGLMTEFAVWKTTVKGLIVVSMIIVGHIIRQAVS